MRRPSAFAVASMALASILCAPTRAQEPSLREVLQRAGDYVAQFSRTLAGMVAEEQYVQDVDVLPGRLPPDVSHRELKSDFLLVRLSGFDRYVEFRDVFEVDGRPVRGRDDRLTRLLRDPAAAAQSQAAAIVNESARYNIGRLTRTVNTPMLPLQFLAADVQPRFEFERSADSKPSDVKAADGNGHFSVRAEVWAIHYREKQRGTVIRTPQGQDLPAHGRFWIDPESGRVLMSELLTEDANVTATITVSYQSEPLLGMYVPAEMRERYVLKDATVVRGDATYGRFRQFTVKTEENIEPPAK